MAEWIIPGGLVLCYLVFFGLFVYLGWMVAND